jgi:predicted nucleic-acid-binding Zn-ribbon protein
MYTEKEPNHCPKCLSKNLFLEPIRLKKDRQGMDTDTVTLGVWYCNKCGELVGRKMSEFYNDIDANSI